MNMTNAHLVDLSLPIYHDMPIWSGEPKIGGLDYFKTEGVPASPSHFPLER